MDDPSHLNLRQRLGFLAKDSALYGAAYAFNKAFALITFPLLARHFSVQDYGLIDFFNTLAVLLTTFLVFGQDSAVARFFYEQTDVGRRKEVISQSFVVQIALLALLIPILSFLSEEFAFRLNEAPESALLTKLVLAQCPFLLFINFSQNILKWTFARARFLLISIGSTVFAVTALLVGLAAFDLSVVQVMVIYLVTQALFGLLGLVFVRQWLVRPREWFILRDLLVFAAPYGLICVVASGIPVLERVFVTQFIGQYQLGLFAAATKIAMLIALPIKAFQVAWGPFSLAIFKKPDAAETYNWVLKGFVFFVLVLTLVLTAVSEPLILLLASSRYSGASVIVFCIAFRLAVEAVGWITGVGIVLSMRSHLNLYSYGVFLLVSVIAIRALIGTFGLLGVAWGGALGYIAKTTIESWLAQRVYPLPWSYSAAIKLTIVTLIAGGASQLASVRAGAAYGSLIAALGAVLLVGLGWFHVLTSMERERILTALSVRRRVVRPTT